tara:strand:+ start:1252 stop:1656 length:405 start_codon:yes stop_codon:yes gene_type:complete
MNKLKIPLALVHTVFGFFGVWVFLGNDYVRHRVGNTLTYSLDVYQILTNLFAFAVLYSPVAFLLFAYLLIKNKIILRVPLLVLNILISLVYVALTYHYINLSLEFNSGLNLPLFSIYLALICAFISYRLNKIKT